MKKEHMTIYISRDVMDKFKEHCRENGYGISAKIEILLKEYMEIVGK